MGIYLQKDNIMEYWGNIFKALISKIDSFEYYKTKKQASLENSNLLMKNNTVIGNKKLSCRYCVILSKQKVLFGEVEKSL